MVEEGLAAVRVPGRLEVLGRRPLLLVDGAHNAAGMAALADALAEEFAVDGTSVAVVGMLSGRDPSAMLAPLASVGVAAIVACEPDSPRAMPVAAVSEAGRALGLSVYEEPDVSDALRVARGMVDADGLVVVAGRSTSWVPPAPTRWPRPSPGRKPAADRRGRSPGPPSVV